MTTISPLSPSTFEAYLHFFSIIEDEKRARTRLERLQERAAAGKRHLEDTLLALDADGRITVLFSVLPIGHGEFQITRPVQAAEEPTEDVFPALFRAAIDRVRAQNGTIISFRPLTSQMTPAMQSALEHLGFICLGERVEFKTPLADLPAKVPGTLMWATMSETGIDLAAETLGRASQGDPHGMGIDENPRAVIEGYFNELELTSDPSCVHIGYSQGEPVAFVCAQVEPSTGWSRIAYMGLVPEARGKGLGREVHLHGIQMLREQGGTLYHGGTARENKAMIHLFQTHGCVEYAAMMEWEWHR